MPNARNLLYGLMTLKMCNDIWKTCHHTPPVSTVNDTPRWRGTKLGATGKRHTYSYLFRHL